VADGQQLVRLDSENSHAGLSSDITGVLAHTGGTPIVVFSDYNKGVLDRSNWLIKEIPNSRVLVDPKRDLENYYGAWLVKPNRREFEQFFGKFETPEDIIDLARQAMDDYCISNVLVTLGADGMLLVTPDSYRGYESSAQEVFDITGAGDVVLSVIAYALSHGIDLELAVGMASRAAGRAVAHHGNYIVRPDDISQFATVFTNGCFDILHRGHIEYLKQSRALGNRLVVGLNSDASIKRLKGADRPINSEQDRKAVLEALDCVDEVIVFDEDTPEQLIRRLRPDVITKGGDYQAQDVVGRDLVKSVIILPYVKDTSTSNIIDRIKHAT
jgi:D-beta-D-heptose 7-phosphate kinase/D-beta-D-heptose 1-phosphate adenosyltransferase